LSAVLVLSSLTTPSTMPLTWITAPVAASASGPAPRMPLPKSISPKKISAYKRFFFVQSTLKRQTCFFILRGSAGGMNVYNQESGSERSSFHSTLVIARKMTQAGKHYVLASLSLAGLGLNLGVEFRLGFGRGTTPSETKAHLYFRSVTLYMYDVLRSLVKPCFS
jgi:hypothetical protein